MYRKFVSKILAVCLGSALLAVPVSAARVELNGTVLTQEEGWIEDGISYISLDALSREGDYLLSWSEGLARLSGQGAELTARPGNRYVEVNGRALYVMGGVRAVDGSPALPLRLLENALGAEVVWNGEEKIASLTWSYDEMHNLYEANGITSTGFNNGDTTTNSMYLKYFNSEIHNSIPLPFNLRDTFYQNGKNYVNLIINLAPSVLTVSDAGEVDYKNIWYSSVETEISVEVTISGDTVEKLFSQIANKSTTIFFYEINYADPLKNKAEYATMPWQDMDVYGETIRVIDLNLDGNYSVIDREYSRYIASYVDYLNYYKLSDIMNITIWPPFLQNGMVVIESSNSDIAQVIIENGEVSEQIREVYVQIKAIGTVTFTVYSPYNVSATRPEFTLNIINSVNDFALYSDLSYSEDVSNDLITIVKNPDITNTLYANLTSKLTVDNPALANYIQGKAQLNLKTSSNYGIRYFYINENGDGVEDDSLLFTGNNSVNQIKLNKQEFDRLYFDASYGLGNGVYALYADSNNKLELIGWDVGQLKLLAVPYVLSSSGEVVYLFDFAKSNKIVEAQGIFKIIDIKVIKGTYGVTSTVAPNISPLNTAIINVNVNSDDENVKLYFNINKTQPVIVYSDTIKSNIIL